MIRTGYLPANISLALFSGLATFLLVFVLVAKVLWDTPYPYALRQFDLHMLGWTALRLHALDTAFFPDIAYKYALYLENNANFAAPWMLTIRFDVAALLALISSAVVGYFVGKPLPDTKTVAGRRLFEGNAAHKALKESSGKDISVSGVGIKLHPKFSWNLSRDRETRHFFIMGSVGGGKTQILTPLLQAAIERGDKVILYDNKTEFTANMNAPFVLFAPWDSRSVSWDIAQDCTNRQDARELAARLIPEGHEPMWHLAARQVLTAIVIKLQQEMPKSWTWCDFFDIVSLSSDDLLKIVEMYQPEARHLLESESKTTQGILINFAASMSIVSDLADAWGHAKPENRFSFTHWLKDTNPAKKIVILQASGRYEELTRGYVQSVISLLSGRINSGEIGESKTRRLWIFMDEFPQLGKLERFSSILEVGRSKGVCVVLGAQDMAQIQEIYGQYIGRTWGSLVGTQIVVRINSETAK
jgi:hypothetical protein